MYMIITQFAKNNGYPWFCRTGSQFVLHVAVRQERQSTTHPGRDSPKRVLSLCCGQGVASLASPIHLCVS